MPVIYTRTDSQRLTGVRAKVKNLNLKLILILTFVSLFIVFITQNTTVVDVRLLFWNVSMSRALLIFFLLIIGIALGWFLHSYLSYRKSKDESGGDV
ncbi:MAG: LapA family protein [Syntrophales bacterium]